MGERLKAPPGSSVRRVRELRTRWLCPCYRWLIRMCRRMLTRGIATSRVANRRRQWITWMRIELGATSLAVASWMIGIRRL